MGMITPRHAMDGSIGLKDVVVPSSLTWLIVGFLSSMGYFLGAKLGFAFTFQPHPVSVMWPPNSIVMAILLLIPARLWWLVLLMTLPAHLAAEAQSDVPLPMVLCWFVSNSCEALIGAVATRVLIGDRVRFERLRDVLIFLLCGALCAPFVSSFLDAGFVALNNWGDDSYWQVWRMRVFSNVFAAVTIVPTIVAWTNNGLSLRFSIRRSLEACILLLGLLTVIFFTFYELPADTGTIPFLLSTPLPFLLWAAIRFGVQGASATILMAAILAMWSSVHARGPFLSGSAEENAISIQAFFTLLAITLIPLAAVLKERRVIANALSASEQRYREVIESQSEIVSRFFADTTFTFVNEACCRFFGLPREDLIGRKMLDLVPSGIHERILLNCANVIVRRQPVVYECEALVPQRGIDWQQWIIHPIISPDGHIREIQAVGRDISDRKRAEEANRNLAHASRLALVGELTAVIAHEVSQPLGAILTNVESARELSKKEKIPVGELGDALDDIRVDILRAAEAVHRVRALSKKRELELASLPVNALVEEVLRLVSSEAVRRHVGVRMHLNRDLPLVWGDSVSLQQVILNLVLNAIDAMSGVPKDARSLTVRTSRTTRGEIVVTVSDTGPGVPPQLTSQIFQSFFSTKPDGVGLGLSIARSILDAHGGRIWVQNNRERGATFSFTLRPYEVSKELKQTNVKAPGNRPV